ncbi:MAG: metallophosphoesterase [Candidatus Brocadiia bacterium]
MPKVLVTADLHWNLYPRGDAATEKLAELVCGSEADVFVIAGDVADSSEKGFAECLSLFGDFDGVKLLVPGNHDLWTRDGDSERLYREVLPRISRGADFHYLDKSPVIHHGLGFIGNIGWYDYSFRNQDIGLTLEDYRNKTMPGVCSWNDRVFIRWDYSDEQFTQMCLRKLRGHYREVAKDVDSVIAILHHLPFAELMYGPADPPLEFCRAYLGTAAFGKLLSRCEKVECAVCGHRHGADEYSEGGLRTFVVGSEYEMKRMMEIDTETGAVAWRCVDGR